MTAFKQITSEMIQENIPVWSKNVWISEKTLRRLIFEQDSINHSLAQKFVDRAGEFSHDKWTIETFFDIEKVRGYDAERKVVYTYGMGLPVTKEEWIAYYRYISEKKKPGYMGIVVLVIILIASSAWILLDYLF